MNKFSSDDTPPAVEIIDIGHPQAANGRIELVDQDLVQLEFQPLKARQVIVRLGCGVLVYSSTHRRVRTRLTLIKDHVGYLTFGPGASGTANGLQVHHDRMLAVPTGATFGMVVNPGYESIGFLVRPEVIAPAQTSAAKGRGHLATPREFAILEGREEAISNLHSWCKAQIMTAMNRPELFMPSSAHSKAMEAELVERLLTTLADTRRFEPERRERAGLAKSTIVQTVEKFVLTRMGDRIYVDDLCRAAAVSERTLEYAFRAVMGLSPTSYLTKIRLHKVHQALLFAKPGSTTVTTQALHWGFMHFGEFAKAYKKCFDELPSETLRRGSQLMAA